jgi:hypothetical protein
MLETSNGIMNEMETTQLATNEVERLRAYKRIYVETHPLPTKKKLNFLQMLGIEALATLLSGIGGVVLAAVRTATIFYLTEQSLLVTYNADLGTTFSFIASILPLFAMISALFAVEGFLFAKGLSVGRSKKDVKGAPWGMFFAIGISVVAGIVASLPLVKNLSVTSTVNIIFQWALVVMTGIGATILAYYGAENLGSIFVKWDLMQSEAEEEYRIKLATWDENTLRSYNKQGREGIFGLEALPTGIKKESKVVQYEGTEIASTIREYLAANNLSAFDIGIEPGMQMSPSSLAEKLGIVGRGSAVRTALSRIRTEEKVKPTEEISII